jgi:hypothetical protein
MKKVKRPDINGAAGKVDTRGCRRFDYHCPEINNFDSLFANHPCSSVADSPSGFFWSLRR